MDHKSYQFEGVEWCVGREKGIVEGEGGEDVLRDIRGGILADEMGLGKTIMMIGTFLCNFVPRTLIVVPVILIEQWYSQIYKTTGHKAIIYHGVNKKKYSLADLNNAIIVITSYSHVAITVKQKNGKKGSEGGMLHQVDWSRVVFDEAHHLRNKVTARFFGVTLLRTKIVWLVSGTPVQNKRRDFYHLCSLLKIPSTYYTNTENIPFIMNRLILRRTKQQVGISIPPLLFIKEQVTWKNKLEMNLSHLIHSQLKMNMVIYENEVERSVLGENPFNNRFPLELIMRAKQTCIMPKLLGGVVKRMVYSGKLERDMLSILPYSSKINAVIERIVERKDNGNGKIIFCNYRAEIDEIRERLEEEGIFSIGVFDGRLKKSMRKECLSIDYEVLIIQIQTGCEGLNLQDNYSEIYLVSPNWNPYIEDQAVARCHRIGQKKEVSVYKFEMLNDCSDSQLLNNMDILLDIHVIKNILEYIPVCNLKWINLDEYIHLVQDNKREIVREIICDV